MSSATIEVREPVPGKPGFYSLQYVDVTIEMAGSSWVWFIHTGGEITERNAGHKDEKTAAEHAAAHFDGEVVETF